MSNTAESTPKSEKLSWLFSKINIIKSKWITQWKWISRILTIGAIVFLALIFYQSWTQLKSVSWQSFLPALLISLGLYLASIILHMAVWIHMLSFYHKVGWRDVEIYMQAVLMRRLPGGAWHWVGRSSSYSANTTVGAGPILKANVLEWIILVITAIGVTGIFMIGLPIVFRGGLVAVSLVLGIYLANTWFPRGIAASQKIVMGFCWMLAYAGSWFLGGMILYLLMIAVQGSGANIAESTAIWAIAGGVSMLMIILPSGLGIREVSLAFLLRPYAPLSIAILIALLIRLTFSLADVLWGAIGWLISRGVIKMERS